MMEYKGYTIREASDWAKKFGIKIEYFFPGDRMRFADSIEEAKEEIDELTFE